MLNKEIGVCLESIIYGDSFQLQGARAADFVLIPCRPAILDLEAIASTLDLGFQALRPACSLSHPR